MMSRYFASATRRMQLQLTKMGNIRKAIGLGKNTGSSFDHTNFEKTIRQVSRNFKLSIKHRNLEFREKPTLEVSLEA